MSSTSIDAALKSALRRMDEEATTTYPSKKGDCIWPSGLFQYHRHYNAVHGGRRGCEPAWSQRIAKLLCESGLPAESEIPFPSYALPESKRRQWCDVVIRRPGDTMWLEVKGSWPVCLRRRRDGSIEDYIWGRYKSYLLEETAEDFVKLARLKRPEADSAGVLLIGFDAPKLKLDADVSRLASGLDSGWSGSEIDSWDEPYWRTKARVWFWTRRLD